MLKTNRLLALFLILGIWSCGPVHQEFETDYLSVQINEQGQITSFYDKSGGKEYLPEGQIAPLLSIRLNDSIYDPVSMDYDKENNLIKLSFAP